MTLFGNLRISSKGRQPKDGRRVHPAEEGQGTLAKSPSTNSSEIMVYQDAHHRHNDRKKTADETGLSSRSLRRHPSNGSDDGAITRSAALNMMSHERSVRKALPTLKPGVGVASKKNAQVNLIVVRNPKTWSQGDEDGGAGKPGMISAINEASETCTVYWYETGQVHDHYRIGKKSELCVPHGAIPASLGGDDGLASAGMAQSAMQAMKSLLTGRRAKGRAPSSAPVERSSHRRNSQETYAEKTQTIVIFDWDDTLFPTTFIRHDLGLSVRKTLRDQNLRPEMMSQVQTTLAKAAGAVDQLLRLADKRGKVVIVTLAKSPWVTDSCRYFYPGIGELIEKLGIQIVYAQEGEQVEYSKVNMMAEEQFETFWAEMKGKAIARALSEFYSQYEGQSWKNIISLGDSDFERYGAMAATMQYAVRQGLVSEADIFPARKAMATKTPQGAVVEVGSQLSVSDVKHHINVSSGRRMSWEGTVNGHEFKVRTKTFKMLDDPTVEELMVELRLLQQWLPMMVKLNDSFDVDLNCLDDKTHIDKIENTLRLLES